MEKKKLIEIANLRQYFPVKKESLLQKEQLYVDVYKRQVQDHTQVPYNDLRGN